MFFSSQYGNTPLHSASRDGHYEVAKILVQSQATMNVKNNVSTSCHLLSLSLVSVIFAVSTYLEIVIILWCRALVLQTIINCRVCGLRENCVCSMCVHMCIGEKMCITIDLQPKVKKNDCSYGS